VNDSREKTLDELCASLPHHHRANRQLRELRGALRHAEAEARVLTIKDRDNRDRIEELETDNKLLRADNADLRKEASNDMVEVWSGLKRPTKRAVV
jgi:hypothetical protein